MVEVDSFRSAHFPFSCDENTCRVSYGVSSSAYGGSLGVAMALVQARQIWSSRTAHASAQAHERGAGV